MTDLRAALELAADDLETRDLTRSVVAAAHRRRTRRRGALAAVAAGVAVAGVVVVPRALDSSDPVREPTGTPTPAPDPTPDAGGPVAPPISEDVIQRAWDPATAGDLPFYPIGHIPTVLAPGGGGEPRPGSTTGVLALSRDDRDRLAVLYGERGWYGLDRVPGVGDVWASALSRDGSRMAVVGVGGLFWCPAAEECPDWQRVDVPDRLGEDVHLVWSRDSSALVVAGFRTGYLVDLDSGDVTELPYLGDFAAFDVAPDGRIVARELEPRSLAEWDGPEQVTEPILSGELGGLNDIAVVETEIAATRIDLSYSEPRTPSDGDGLVVLDRDSLTTLGFLPFTGVSGQWVDGEQVKPVQWINKVTVLMSVLVDDRVWLVTWDYRSGAMGYVTWYPASYDVSLRELYPS